MESANNRKKNAASQGEQLAFARVKADGLEQDRPLYAILERGNVW